MMLKHVECFSIMHVSKPDVEFLVFAPPIALYTTELQYAELISCIRDCHAAVYHNS